MNELQEAISENIMRVIHWFAVSVLLLTAGQIQEPDGGRKDAERASAVCSGKFSKYKYLSNLPM